MRRIVKITLSMFVAFIMMTCTASASDSNVEFSGDAKDFIFLNDDRDLFDSMKQMMPGETRNQNIRLENSDDQNLKFYLKIDVLQALDNGTNGLGVYTITLKNNGEEIYQGKINGLKGLTQDGLKDNEILLADLETGEQTEVELSMYLDGDSMDNTYQDKEGAMQFTFSVEHKDPTPREVITTIVNKVLPGVRTGDALWVGGFVILFAISAFVLIVILRKRRRGNEDC